MSSLNCDDSEEPQKFSEIRTLTRFSSQKKIPLNPKKQVRKLQGIIKDCKQLIGSSISSFSP